MKHVPLPPQKLISDGNELQKSPNIPLPLISEMPLKSAFKHTLKTEITVNRDKLIINGR